MVSPAAALRKARDLWVAPVRAEPIAAFRICLSVIVLVNTITLLPSARDWFGVHGVFSPAQFEEFRDSWLRWSLLPAEASDPVIYLVLGLLALAAGLTAIGAGTRIASIVMWILLVSVQVRNPEILNGGDMLLRAGTFYLMLMPAGSAWSVDNLVRARLGRPADGVVPAWSLRFAQLQLLLVYLFTAVEKLAALGFTHRDTGPPPGDWITGAAVHRALTDATIGRVSALFEPLPRWLFAPATWLVLGWELGFAALVWWPRTRWPALAFGYLVHVGIFLGTEVIYFSPVVLAFYVLFLPPNVMMDIAGEATGQPGRRRYVVSYDSSHAPTARMVRLLRRLDWLGRLTLVDQPDQRTLHVTRPDGDRHDGFAGLRAIAVVLPPCWPIVPVLWLPGMAWLGARAATRRSVGSP